MQAGHLQAQGSAAFPGRMRRAMRPTALAHPTSSATTQTPPVWGGAWSGRDEWTMLDDRKAQPPLHLPPIERPQRVTLVRHGQSTWNAASVVQGSSNISVLTAKGVAQARAAAEQLAAENFDQLWYSPLARASQTAQVVWGSRVGPQHCDPVLREIDLYSFQGLEKSAVKRLYPEQHFKWQRVPEEFELDGHLPVHETWYRASLAWQKILVAERSGSSTLVVAHNNINQGLIATALQLPCTFFRRLTQNNAAVSQLQFTPSAIPGEPPEAVLLCLNQSHSSSPVKPSSKVAARVALLVAPSDPAQQQACISLLATMPARHVVVLPAARPSEEGLLQQMACALGEVCRTARGDEPSRVALQHEAGNHAWHSLCRMASDDGGCSVVVVVDAQSAAGLTCSAFGLGQMARHKFSFQPGGVTVFDFGGPPVSYLAAARCINSTAHLLAAAPAGQEVADTA